jgi:hypothetical protein
VGANANGRGTNSGINRPFGTSIGYFRIWHFPTVLNTPVDLKNGRWLNFSIKKRVSGLNG